MERKLVSLTVQAPLALAPTLIARCANAATHLRKSTDLTLFPDAWNLYE